MHSALNGAHPTMHSHTCSHGSRQSAPAAAFSSSAMSAPLKAAAFKGQTALFSCTHTRQGRPVPVQTSVCLSMKRQQSTA